LGRKIIHTHPSSVPRYKTLPQASTHEIWKCILGLENIKMSDFEAYEKAVLSFFNVNLIFQKYGRHNNPILCISKNFDLNFA